VTPPPLFDYRHLVTGNGGYVRTTNGGKRCISQRRRVNQTISLIRFRE
jgi:hypothetical protein